MIVLWIIESVNVYFQDTGMMKRQFTVLSKSMFPQGHYVIGLFDTVSGKQVVSTLRSYTDIISMTKVYEPYGVCREGEDLIAVTVDKMSLQFLEFVQASKQVTLTYENPAFHRVKSLGIKFKNLDSYNTIFYRYSAKPGSASRVPCTILQAIASCKVNMVVDGSLYLPHVENSVISGAAYKVDFTDVQTAMRYVTKSLVIGNNRYKKPELAYIGSEG